MQHVVPREPALLDTQVVTLPYKEKGGGGGGWGRATLSNVFRVERTFHTGKAVMGMERFTTVYRKIGDRRN